MIGYGVVGSGYFGAELARIMNTKPGAVIRAVHDPETGPRWLRNWAVTQRGA